MNDESYLISIENLVFAFYVCFCLSERCSFSCAEFWSPSPALLCCVFVYLSGVLFPVPSFGVRRRLCSVCVVPDLRNVYVLRSSISQCAALISSQRSQQDFPAQLIFPAPVDSLCSRFLPPPLNLRGYSCFVIQHLPEFVFSVSRAAGLRGFCYHSRVRLLFVFSVSVESRCSALASFPPSRFGLCH
jgi:hypothetical protein